jgi:hypothetical protein
MDFTHGDLGHTISQRRVLDREHRSNQRLPKGGQPPVTAVKGPVPPRSGRATNPPNGSDPRATPHPVASILQAARLTGAWQQVPRKDYLALTGWPNSPFTGVYQRLRDDPDWTTHELPVGHNVMADAPDALLEILVRVAAGRAVDEAR